MKGGDIMAKENYTGKIKNTGNQVVEPPVKMPSNKGGGKVQKGIDLRSKG
jgi:hypothetical protein